MGDLIDARMRFRKRRFFATVAGVIPLYLSEVLPPTVIVVRNAETGDEATIRLPTLKLPPTPE